MLDLCSGGKSAKQGLAAYLTSPMLVRDLLDAEHSPRTLPVCHRLTEWCVWCVCHGMRTAVLLLKLRLGVVLGVRLLRILT